MTQTQARMAELHTKQCLEEPPHTLLSTKTQVGTSAFPVPVYTISMNEGPLYDI